MGSERFTALEIQRRTFSRRLHGLDAREVRDLLDHVALQIENDARERGELRAEVARLSRAVDELRSREGSVAEALAAARQEAGQVISRAEADAEEIVREAQAFADRILDEASRRTESIELVIGQLRARRRTARADLRRLAELIRGVIDEDEITEGSNGDTQPLKVVHRNRDRTAER